MFTVLDTRDLPGPFAPAGDGWDRLLAATCALRDASHTFPKSKKHVSLMFHQGATIPGEHPLLEGDGDVGRAAKFTDLEDVERRRPELEAIIRAWCDDRDAA